MSTMQILAEGYHAARQRARQHAHERRATRTGTRTAPVRLLGGVAEHGLAVAGLGCFVAAALLVAIPLGLLVAGGALFVLELRVSGGGDGR